MRLPKGGYIPLLGSFTLVWGSPTRSSPAAMQYRNRDLVLVGTLYKLAYSAVAVFFVLIDQVPHGVFVVLGAFDLVFLVLMSQCWLVLRRTPDRSSP